MTTTFRHYSAIVFILASLLFHAPNLLAWGEGRQSVLDANNPAQTGGDGDKKGIVRKERPAHTPVYNVETAKPHSQSAIERQPVPPVTANRPVQQEGHFRPAGTVQFQPREGSRENRPGLLERKPLPDRNTFQPQPSISVRERDQKELRHDRPHITGNNPFDADRNDNTFIKPAFEHRDRNIRDSREIRHRDNIVNDRGIDRTPVHRPVIGERIHPARGMGFYRELPPGHNRVFVKNQVYFIHEGRFYRKAYDGFIWIVPPVGFVVTTLPFGCTSFMWEGVEYYTYAGIYYRPTYGGYVVVEEPEDLPSPWVLDPPPVNFVMVNTELLNVRSGPGEDFPVIEQTMYGERLQVLGSYEDWYYVRLANGRKGFVLAYYTYPENQPEPRG